MDKGKDKDKDKNNKENRDNKWRYIWGLKKIRIMIKLMKIYFFFKYKLY